MRMYFGTRFNYQFQLLLNNLRYKQNKTKSISFKKQQQQKKFF